MLAKTRHLLSVSVHQCAYYNCTWWSVGLHLHAYGSHRSEVCSSPHVLVCIGGLSVLVCDAFLTPCAGL